MGNQNSALLEAASAGDTSKAQKLLETVEVNWKGQVTFPGARTRMSRSCTAPLIIQCTSVLRTKKFFWYILSPAKYMKLVSGICMGLYRTAGQHFIMQPATDILPLQGLCLTTPQTSTQLRRWLSNTLM